MNSGHTYDYVSMVEYMEDHMIPDWILWDGEILIIMFCHDMQSFKIVYACIPRIWSYLEDVDGS